MSKITKDGRNVIIRTIIELGVIGVLIAADLMLKDYLYLVTAKGTQYVDVIKGFIGLTYVTNNGAGFGTFSSKTLALAIVSLIILTVIAVALLVSAITEMKGKKSKSGEPLELGFMARFALALILAGGIANVVDRFMALSGKYYFDGVRDFFNFEFFSFPVFNAADVYVTVGAFVLIIYLIVQIFVQGAKDRKARNN